MRPLFADPKTDFAFKKIFGTEEHKPLLMALLNGLLELDEAHRVVEVQLLASTRNSILDVQCVDTRGAQYRVTIREAAWRPKSGPARDPTPTPWRMQDEHGEAQGLGQLQSVALELPEYDTHRPPVTAVEKWAYFFSEALKLRSVPEVLAEWPFRDALEAARAAGFSEEEWEAYLRAGMAIQDERGVLSLADRQGHQRGKLDGVRVSIRKILQKRGLVLVPEQEALLEGCLDLGTLDRWLDQSLTAASASEALAQNT